MHRWIPDDTSLSFYTEKEIRTIHRNFGHPSVNALELRLRRANGPLYDWRTVPSVENICKLCIICMAFGSTPRSFRLPAGSEELRFNHQVPDVDIMFLSNCTVNHMVDEATHFRAASSIRNQSSTETWKSIQNMEILIYLGSSISLLSIKVRPIQQGKERRL